MEVSDLKGFKSLLMIKSSDKTFEDFAIIEKSGLKNEFKTQE